MECLCHMERCREVSVWGWCEENLGLRWRKPRVLESMQAEVYFSHCALNPSITALLMLHT